jgi:hypothetical protein
MSCIVIKLRRKYTAAGQSGRSGGAYRGRTGPNCCGPNCVSGKKKSGARRAGMERPKFGMKL